MRISAATPDEKRYACKLYHYSGSVPPTKYAFSIYNDSDEWCGVILYGFGANSHIAMPYGLWMGEVFELTRVALNGKQETTSKAVAMSLRELRRIDPFVKMVVSYADVDQNHVGTIYQATNWIYEGLLNAGTSPAIIVHGVKTHNRTCASRGWVQSVKWIRENIDPNAEKFISNGKRKYLFAFDKKVRRDLIKLSKPYPKGGA